MDSNCIVCDKPVPRGQRFIGLRYKNLKFCCEDCYTQYCNAKDSKKEKAKQEKIEKAEAKKAKASEETKEKFPGWRNLTDYIATLYPVGTINWMLFAKQIKSYMKEYGLTCDDMRIAIRYAVEFENFVTNPNYGLNQFIPKFVEPSRKFKERIETNRKLADCLEANPVVNVQNKSAQRKYYGKVEDF